METVKKPLALILGVVAFGVLLHFVFNPFYEDLIDVLSIWHVINWFMAFAVVATVAVAYVHKKSVQDDSYMRLWFNLTFHAAAVLAILFFWNWFDDLTVGEDGQSQTRRIFWVFINTLFVILNATVSVRLWKGTSSA